MSSKPSIVIVGAGVFGLSSALELHRRGYARITVIDTTIDEGPNPVAASTDISKLVRSDYGDKEFYSELHTEAIKRWHHLNKKWDEELYHETGVLILSMEKAEKGSFVFDSYQTMTKLGYPVDKLDDNSLRKNHPKWNRGKVVFKDGYVNWKAGWAESGRVVGKWIEEVRSLGISMVSSRAMSLLLDIPSDPSKRSRVLGVQLENGQKILADWTIVAGGAQTPLLLPELQNTFIPVAQPVFHFSTDDKRKLKEYSAPHFIPFGADLQQTGFYGFPVHPKEGVLKIGHHGLGTPLPGQIISKDSLEKVMEKVMDKEEIRFRKFLNDNLPEIGNWKVVFRRLCMYCDTFDGDFLIDRNPNKTGLIVASGGSGHGFKFAPVIGDIVADVLEDKPNPYRKYFRWRSPDTIRSFDSCRYTQLEPSIPLSKL